MENWAIEHWFVVTANAWLISFLASIPFTICVLVIGAMSEFQRLWNYRKDIRQVRFGAGWVYSWVSTTVDSLRGHVGRVPVGELRGEDGQYPVHDDRNVVVLIHGTFGAAWGYNWQRWGQIAQQFPATDWQRLRFAWAGGNSERVRHRSAINLERCLAGFIAASPGKHRIVLVGHSFGGTVACAAARNVAVDDVITIGTPFVEVVPEDQSHLLATLQIGAHSRYLGPMVICLALAASSATFGQVAAADTLWVFYIGALFMGAWFLAMRAGFQERELLRNQVSPSIDARLTIVQSPNDWLVQAAHFLEMASTAALITFHGRNRLARKISAISDRYVDPPPWRRPLRRIGYYISAALPLPNLRLWLHSITWYTLTGTILITGSAAFLYPALPDHWQPYAAPWLLPSLNFFLLKFLFYSGFIAVPYLFFRRALGKHWLPSWHRAAFGQARYWVTAATLSQIFALKAHLYGFRAFTLHLLNIKAIDQPIGTKIAEHRVATVADGIAAHSDLLDAPELLEALHAIAQS